MARSHHRKKHKEHLKQFKQKGDTTIAHTARNKASGVFTIVGGVIGVAVGYLVSHNSFVWALIGLVAGVTAGYLIGRKADAGK